MDDERVDELYAAPLHDFTSARDRLASELKQEGDGDGAKAVKALRKPTVAAWAVNQLARRDSKGLGDLLETLAKMKDTSSPDELRALSERRHALASQLTDRARAILEESGHGASSSTMHLISQTLYAGASDTDRSLLERGRLTRELAPSGFEGVLGLSIEEPSGPQDRESEIARRRAEKLASEAVALEEEATALERDAEAKEAEAKSARRQAEATRRRAVKARERADRA